MGVLARITAHMEASDGIWTIARETKPASARWCMLLTLRLCEVMCVIPPSPFPRAPAVRWFIQVFWLALIAAATVYNQGITLTSGTMMLTGSSSISLMSLRASTVSAAILPPIVLVNSVWNFTNLAPLAAALLMPPVRFHTSFYPVLGFMAGMLFGKHLLFLFVSSEAAMKNFFQLTSSLVSLAFDLEVFFLALCAQDKLYNVNQRLSAVGKVRPELRPLVLETAARQYELTADQVEVLGSMRTLGLPLATNLIRYRIRLVTDSFSLLRVIYNSHGDPTILLVLFLQLIGAISRVFICFNTGQRLYAESKRTEYILGAVNNIDWPERDRRLVDRILRNSRQGICWSMGGIANMNHSHLLSILGASVAILVVIMQYKDPVSDRMLLHNATAAITSVAN